MDVINYDGEYGASSRFNARYNAENAFKPETAIGPWGSKTGAFPAKVWFKFKSNEHLNRISFTSRRSHGSDGLVRQAPETFNVIASNDGKKWSTLLHVKSAGFSADGQTKAWDIACNNLFFKFVGIEVLKTQEGIKRNAAITNITMWGVTQGGMYVCMYVGCFYNLLFERWPNRSISK